VPTPTPDHPDRKTPTHIRDARGRRVTQLDPLELNLLHRHDAIDRDAMRPLVEEIGSGMDDRTRRFLPVLIVGCIAIAAILVVQVVEFAMSGDFRVLFQARNVALANVWFLLLVLWARAKATRFGRVRAVMLKHHRCPHCGYDLRALDADEDGATACPECGCAWRMPTAREPDDPASTSPTA
jgi:hypothetical protein